jgi:hypothetical protein
MSDMYILIYLGAEGAKFMKHLSEVQAMKVWEHLS